MFVIRNVWIKKLKIDTVGDQFLTIENRLQFDLKIKGREEIPAFFTSFNLDPRSNGRAKNG